MIDLIMDLVYHFFRKITGSENKGSRRDTVMAAAVLAVIMLALCACCLIRGWQTNDAYYLVLGFLVLVLTICETARMIRRWRKR